MAAAALATRRINHDHNNIVLTAKRIDRCVIVNNHVKHDPTPLVSEGDEFHLNRDAALDCDKLESRKR